MISSIFSFRSFFIVAAIHLAAIAGGETLQVLAILSKPLLLLLLTIIFFTQSRSALPAFRNLVGSALMFSWAGDVLLLFQEKDAGFFLAGLISFLAAHVCYLLAFNITSVHPAKTLLRQKPWIALLFIGYGVLFFFLIRNGLGNMLLPVMAYMAVILFMALNALNRFRRVDTGSFSLVFGGALCFMLSDSLLACNKFAAPVPMAGLLIMLTYIAAQYLITKGCLQQIAATSIRARPVSA